ncbi:LysR family transcriptional regulator [Nonomuraea sp. NPDC050643]|uniref:LysR family transcriptional regulator n=1 Tax=Nonomuraea sp. NPDC050643 TaxID=3155660 RepID=UPI0033C33149
MSSDFTFQQLRAFLAVADELNFRRAAERLHTTQPALSRQIKALEHTLRAPLFERGTRRVSLTAAGQAFLPEAGRLLSNLESARRAVGETVSGERGVIRFGYLEPAAYGLLPLVLPRFRARFPKIDLELHEMHSYESVRQLRRRAIEVALLRPPVDQDGLHLDIVYADRLVAALPEDHPLAGRTIALSELADESFVSYSTKQGAGVHAAALQACAAGGFSPTIAHLASSTPMLMSLVAAGQGVGLVPQPFTMAPRPGVRFAALTDPEARSFVALARRDDDDRATYRELRAIIEHHAP